MSDSAQHLDLINTANAQQAVTANQLFDALSPASVFGRRASTTAALTWGYYGGKVLIDGAPTEWPDSSEVGSIQLTDNKTQYLEAHRVSATTFSVTGFTVSGTPTVTTSAAHGFLPGQTVYFDGLGGMTQMNKAFATVLTVTSTTFTIDTSTASGFSAYTSGGTVAACGATGTLRLGKNHSSDYSPGSTRSYRIVTGGGLVSSYRDDRVVGAYPSRKARSVAGSADVILTHAEAAATHLEFTGTLTGNIAVIFPPVIRDWPMVYNNTSGAFTLTPRTPSGTGTVIAQGTRERRACDGVDLYPV